MNSSELVSSIPLCGLVILDVPTCGQPEKAKQDKTIKKINARTISEHFNRLMIYKDTKTTFTDIICNLV